MLGKGDSMEKLFMDSLLFRMWMFEEEEIGTLRGVFMCRYVDGVRRAGGCF